MTDLVRKYIPGQGWQTVLDVASGEQSFTITTDPDTFVVSQNVDLGAPQAWQMVMSDLVIVPDGEVFAPSGAPQAGELFVDVKTFRSSLDGITYLQPNAAFTWFYDLPGDEATTQFAAFGYNTRYLQLLDWRIIDSASFDVYAGPNHPTATATFTFTY